MLDLTKIARQMQGLSQHLANESAASRQRLEVAQKLLEEAIAKQTELLEKHEKWRDRFIFAPPVPVEPLETCVDIPVPPKVHTVIATDGSQMSPSHHEIAYCYLLNIGRVMLHYGQGKHPLLDSLPEIFYRQEDIYVSHQWGIKVEEWMGYRRAVSEAVVLAELATNWAKSQRDELGVGSRETSPPNPLFVDGEGEKGREVPSLSNIPIPNIGEGEKKGEIHPSKIPIASELLGVGSRETSPPNPLFVDGEGEKGGEVPSFKIPTLAMVDGSLIYWFLESLPADACDRILPPILDAWEQLRLAGVPLLGYLSASRNSESLSFLRLQACTHSTPNCVVNCGDLQNQGQKTPCQVFDPLRDIVLWSSLLKPGQRSPLWRSTLRILNLYGDAHKVYFCYVHVGTEIARIEVPAWVAENSALLDRSLGLMLAQVQKGYGYPVVLAEAHNQAVVKGSDRARFFAMLEQQMIKAGLRNVGTSYKETRKRGSIA